MNRIYFRMVPCPAKQISKTLMVSFRCVRKGRHADRYRPLVKISTHVCFPNLQRLCRAEKCAGLIFICCAHFSFMIPSIPISSYSFLSGRFHLHCLFFRDPRFRWRPGVHDTKCWAYFHAYLLSRADCILSDKAELIRTVYISGRVGISWKFS